MTDPRRILIVEDDAEIRSLLCDFLGSHGYATSAVGCGAACDRHLADHSVPDLVVLDWMLPGEDGVSICRRLRRAGDVPILMLTARDDDPDRILGLDAGADEYLPKPFNPQVLLAHVRALLRRAAGPAGDRDVRARPIALGDLLVDRAMRRVTLLCAGREVAMTGADFDLLLCFVERPQRVLSREDLMSWTRGRAIDALDRTIDVNVSRLRRRLEEGGSTAAASLKSVRNAGYILAASVRTL